MKWFFGFLWFWLWWKTGETSVPLSEINLLYTLYNLTHGEKWLWREKRGPIWNFTITNNISEVNPCNTAGEFWQGITCSSTPSLCSQRTCSIIKLDLERYGLRDQLPMLWDDLSYLTHLDLSDNRLTGHFPFILPPTLQFLDLSDNQLTNSIPQTFGFLTDLEYFDIESNLLSQYLPSTIVYLTSLSYLSIYTNHFSGSLPSNIGLMISLEDVDIEDNYFAGIIPSSFGALHHLTALDISSNCFSQTIPSEFGFLSVLAFLTVEGNLLTGSLPSTIGCLTALTQFELERNFFTGAIPSEIGYLSHVEILTFYQNSFSGTLPESISLMSSVSFLELSSNFFSGQMPPLSQLTELQIFSAFSNLLSSTVPCDFVMLSKLSYLDLSHNSLDTFCEQLSFPTKLERLEISWNNIQGSIPTTLFSNLVRVEFLDLAGNFLTGQIPSNIDVMTRLGHFDVGQNRLAGSIPPSVSSLTQLVQLYLPENHLNGRIDKVFASAPNMSLISVDLSSNTFEGIIPDELFMLLNLKVLALTSNCFYGSIPPTICESKLLEVISMDGLGAASGCASGIEMIFNNLVTGQIPACLWSFQNLSILSFSGNGLTGTLPIAPLSRSLLNLTLSHNHLSGALPSSLQSQGFRHLDLSYNKLRGEFHGGSKTSHSSRTKLILEVNRLSGSLSGLNLQNDTYLNILTGNIFACDFIPNDDIDSKSYSCGSLMLDEAIIGTCIVISSVVLFYWIFRFRLLPGSATWISQMSNYYTVLSQVNLYIISKELQELSASMNFLQYIEKITIIIVTCCLVFPLPAYALRWGRNSDYSTHNHLYRWSATAAYLTGRIPSVMLIVSWMLTIAVFVYLVRKMKGSSGGRSVLTAMSDSLPLRQSWNLFEWKKALLEKSLTILIVLINMLSIGILNATYILSTTQQNSSVTDFWIKVAVAIFKVLWNALYLPLLDSSKHPQRLKIIIRVFNSIIIPFVATALSSPSCFQVITVNPLLLSNL